VRVIVEKFEDINVDGERVYMEISDKGHVYFCSRFDQFARYLNADISAALDFFRNYAILLSHNELEKGLTTYKKFMKLHCASQGVDFWRLFEGKRPVNLDGKWGCIQWV